jgi:hypothetical protein
MGNRHHIHHISRHDGGSVGDTEEREANVLVHVVGPAAVVAPDGATPVGGAQPGGVGHERAVEDGARLRQVPRGRQPEVQPRRREVQHLQDPPRCRDRQQVEPHRESNRTSSSTAHSSSADPAGLSHLVWRMRRGTVVKWRKGLRPPPVASARGNDAGFRAKTPIFRSR